MGLDMYAYGVKKISAERRDQITALKQDLTHNRLFLVLSYKELNSPDYIAFKPYMTEVTCTIQETDMKKFLTDHGVPTNAELVGHSICGNQRSWTFIDPLTQNHIQVSATTQELLDNYTSPYVRKRYVAFMNQIGYWRKAYDVDEAIQKAFGREVENCSYAYCNEAMLDIMKDNGLEGNPADYDAVFYHIWY